MKLPASPEPWLRSSSSGAGAFEDASKALIGTRYVPQNGLETSSISMDREISNKTTGRTVCQGKRSINGQEFVKLLSNSCPCSSHLMNGEVNRIQLIQIFRDHHIPHSRCPDFAPLMWIANTAFAGSSNALRSAISAVALFTMHRIVEEPRMLPVATIMYANALKEARKELSSSTQPAVNVAISHTFSFCELLCCYGLDDNDTQAHTFYLISMIGTSSKKPQETVLKQIADGNIRAFASWELLILRKCPPQLELFSIDYDLTGECQMSTLIDLALMASKIAERGDSLCQSKHSAPSELLLGHLAEIRRLESHLYDWMGQYSVQFALPTYSLTDAEHPVNPVVRNTKALFGKIYEFPDLRVAIIHITFWMSLVSLFQSYVRMIDTSCIDIGAQYLQYYMAKKMMDEHADHLCKAMPFMGRWDNGFAGRIMATRPLQFLSLHFKEQKNWSKLAWCLHCAVDIGSIRKPSMQSPKP